MANVNVWLRNMDYQEGDRKSIKSSWDVVFSQNALSLVYEQSYEWISLWKSRNIEIISQWNKEEAGNVLWTCDEKKRNEAFSNDRENWWKTKQG